MFLSIAACRWALRAAKLPASMSGNPFSAGFRAARANLLPGLFIQALMVTMVVAYYAWLPARGWFQALAAAKAIGGFAFSFVSAVIAGAILPSVLKWLTLNRGKFSREDWAEFAFLCIFWGIDGTIIDVFYRFQGVIFGVRPDFPVVLKKVLVDQFIYNPLFAAPYTIACFEFKNQRYQVSRTTHVFTVKFYQEQVIPALCATWAVWIPVTSAIYALPLLLQIPLFALALTFWSLLITYLTSRPAKSVEVSALAKVVSD
jgi:hypothetical protein